jgi:hypothetical protein
VVVTSADDRQSATSGNELDKWMARHNAHSA